MNSMTPVVLVSLPNLPYLLGTFDTANFRNWWRSAPFPEELQSIKRGFHIYGRTHLAIAQRIDGRWAIYQSKNYGIEWERVFLASVGEVIYDIVLITFGRAILNTSIGFYETQNAGTTWTLILALPTAPNAPAICNIGGGDVLLCTDGRYIWRSTNIARSWSQVCDMTILEHYSQYPHGPQFMIHYSGLAKPCIAGANGRAYAGHGPFMVRTDDAGLTWTGNIPYWEQFPYDNPLVPPRAVIWDRIWLKPRPQFLITQIDIASVDGPAGDDVVFLFRIDDIYPAGGESSPYARVFKSYTSGANKNNYYKTVFQQFLSPSDGLQLDSYDVPVTGAPYNDKLIFSAQTRTDPTTGKPIPSLKYSLDGGQTWYDIDLNTVRIGDPAGGGNYGGSMLDDNFAKLTWIAPACNNQGSYNYVELFRRQCQSYEADLLLESAPFDKMKIQKVDVLLSQDAAKEDSLDVICEKIQRYPYHADALLKGRPPKTYQCDGLLQGKVSHESPVDAILSVDMPCPYQIDVGRMWKQPRKYYHLDALMRTIVGRNYSCDVVLVENKLIKRLSRMVGKNSQFMDFDVPEELEGAFDSKRETV